jgi:hypothetical protein
MAIVGAEVLELVANVSKRVTSAVRDGADGRAGFAEVRGPLFTTVMGAVFFCEVVEVLVDSFL